MASTAQSGVAAKLGLKIFAYATTHHANIWRRLTSCVTTCNTKLATPFAAALFFAFCTSIVDAQILDRIDLVSRDSDADIVIRFTHNIQYLRHTPLNNGKVVRVFLRVVDPVLVESDLAQETLQSQKTARGIPAVNIVFPELINSMLVTFSQSTRYTVRPGSDARSIIITVPQSPEEKLVSPAIKAAPIATTTAAASAAPTTAPIPAPINIAPESIPPRSNEIAPTVSAGEVDAQAKSYIDEARQAMLNKDMPTAINRLNRILGLPRNNQTEPAQALMGEAREMNGEYLKAKAEYELYLSLFPTAPSVAKIKTRLAGLPKDEAARAALPKPLPKEAGIAEWTYSGSLSSYYYTGKSQIETLTPPPPGQLTFNQDTLSAIDQRSLISSINLNIRRRDAFSDTRIVFRDTDNHNDLSPARSYNRVYSAYVDHADKRLGYNFRLGRQSPNGIGVLDRFDGIQGGYNLTPSWRANGVYGDAVEFGSPFKKSFYGASIDFLTGKPSWSAYAIQQTIDGLVNRRALGTEVRYFDGGATAYGMLDYDVLYKGVNIALLQGNYLDNKQNNYFFVIDHRRAPTYSLTNALPGAPGLSLKDLVSAQGIVAVRQQAIALSAMSDSFNIGVNHPISERWQIGADYRLSQISGTLPVDAVIPLAVIGTCLGTVDPVNNTCVFNTASQPASGKTHTVTFQASGINLFFANAVGTANLSLIKAPTYDGQNVSLNYGVSIGDRWRLEPILRYYNQKDNDGGTADRFGSSFKIAWQWQNRLYLEGEAGRETSKTNSPIRTDHSTRDYLYLGLRGEFR